MLVAACVAGGCGVFASAAGPDEVTAEFFGALAKGDTARAAELTDAPDSAKAVLDQARSALAPESIDVEVRRVHNAAGSSTATANFRLAWHLPHARLWAYDGEAQLYSANDRWQIHWLPSALHPQLAAQQTLALRAETPELAPVLDRDGATLLDPQTVVSVLLDPAKAGELDPVAGKLAAALHPLDESITKQSIVDGVKGVRSGDSYPVASLRATDYQQVRPSIYELPGVRFTQQERLLPADKQLAEQVLPALRSTVEEQVTGKAGWRVVTLDATGGEVTELHAQAAQPAGAVVSTLSRRIQAAGEQALADAPGPAALVAVQPSTGEILAVAQNAAADAEGAIALTGRYPPGSTFKIATATAALSADKVKSDTPVDCPATATFDGRVVPNDDRFALGTVPLSTAFARSCNTTFAKLSTLLPATALTDAARDLGIGADFVLPGLTTITGSVPPAGNLVQQAENGFGQGTVLASPFGMAIATATVAAGRIPVPVLLRGTPAQARHLGRPIRPDVLAALRGMTREVVTAGTAGALAELPEVHGKTGTAQFGDGTRAHGWFVGYTGDLAFSVLLVGGGTSAPAVGAAHRFLTAIG